MQITITLDTDALSADQVTALGTLVGTNGSAPVSAPAAPKAAPAAKKAAPKAEKAAPAPEPEPEDEAAAEPEAEDEDLVGGDGPTMEDAVALATKLVSSGQAAKVKAALGEVGAKKVSEIAPDDIATFVAALS